MTEIDKEKKRIINKFGIKPSILYKLPPISKEEFNKCFQEYKEFLINFIRCYYKF